MDDNREKIEEAKRNFVLTGGVTGLLAAASMLSGPVSAANNTEIGKNGDTWKWLVGTTWCVPEVNSSAYKYIVKTDQMEKVGFQTVYEVTGYDFGAFWGRSGSFIDGHILYNALFCTVTPDGKILMSFRPYLSTLAATVSGYGQMLRKAGQWTMQNQMFQVGFGDTLGQWAHMIQTRPGTKNWESLAVANMSVPDFMANCPPAPSSPTA
jgi:hypothetical protein